jgi:hypothetical protein
MPKPVKGADLKNDPDKGVKVKKNRGRRSDGNEFPGVSVAAHPRAGASVRRIKGVGGLAGFGIAAGLSAQAGVPTEMIGERAMIAGVAGYVIAWGTSVTVWRQLVLAELRTASERAEARHEALREARRAQQPGI